MKLCAKKFQVLVRYTLAQNRTYKDCKVISYVGDKWEAKDGRSVVFAALMDPYSGVASWAAPQDFQSLPFFDLFAFNIFFASFYNFRKMLNSGAAPNLTFFTGCVLQFVENVKRIWEKC